MWFESATVEAVRDAFPEWTAFVFAFLSALGSVWFVVPVTVSLYWFRDRHRFGPWLGVVAGCYALMHALKGLFETPRPDVGPAVAPETLPTVVAVAYAPFVEVGTTSFPSGHVLAAVVVWTMLALETDLGRRRRSLVVAAVIVALVGFARIGVGVHFPLDVLAGAIAGVCYVGLVLAIRSRVRTTDTATQGTFAVGAVLALAAFAIDPAPNPATLFGGCLGAAFAWRSGPPSRAGWPIRGRVLAGVLLGLGAVGLLGAVAAAVDTAIGWVAVGVVGGAVVVGLPRAVGDSSLPRADPRPSSGSSASVSISARASTADC